MTLLSITSTGFDVNVGYNMLLVPKKFELLSYYYVYFASKEHELI